jgi:general secretion pathway protein K
MPTMNMLSMPGRSHNNAARQRGVALITVLFLFALAAVILSALLALLQTSTQRASAALETEQAYLLALSGEEWARQLLAKDYKVNPNIDHMHELWAENGKILDVDNGYIEISIKDAQGKFNINNLATSTPANLATKVAFQRLIDNAIKDQQLSTTIAEEFADWLDADNLGIEESDYLSEAIPYKPPNTAITDISEIRFLKDMDSESYKMLHQEIFPSLAALPKQTLVNINTVSPQVLAGMSGLSITQAESIVEAIQGSDTGYPTVATATINPQVLAQAASFGVSSEYFEVRVRAKFAEHYAFLSSIIFRDNQNGGRMTVISRDRSGRFIFPFSKDYNADGKSKDYEIDI